MKKYVKTFQEFINESYDSRSIKNDWWDLVDSYSEYKNFPELSGDEIQLLVDASEDFVKNIDKNDLSTFIDFVKKHYNDEDSHFYNIKKTLDFVNEHWDEIDELLDNGRSNNGGDATTVNKETIKVEKFSEQMKELENFINENYEIVGRGISTMETRNGYYLSIPITDDCVIVPYPDVTSEDNIVYSICTSPELQRYIKADKTYYCEEFDFEDFNKEIGELIDEDNILEIRFNDPYKDWTNENIVSLLEDLLNGVPNPVLRKISE